MKLKLTQKHCPTIRPGPSPASEQDALVALYNATDGANWRDSTNWLSDQPIAFWYGVTTDDSGHVIQLKLNGNSLAGLLPTELENLTQLKYLILSNNNLTGPLPAELGNLTKLEVADSQ